ncbi:ATPase, T2SS/T4P/T4SS family, partial [Thermodesulfobacteriota bacterium]
ETSTGSTLRIGELLIQEGFLTKSEVARALTIQTEEREFSKLPLGKVLVRMGALNDDDIEEALNHPNLRKSIGSLAVEKGLITKEDLEMVLKNKKQGQLIGELLLSYGLLTSDDIGRLLKEQINSPKLGQVLVDLKLISESDVQLALRKQRTTRALGEILCDLKLVNPVDLNYVLEKYDKQIGIADILLKLGYVNNDKLLICKKEQAQTAEPLGKVLIKKKFISTEQLQAAIARKYNLPFLQLNDFSYGPTDKNHLVNLISQKYAEKNLLLPLSLVDKTLTIAISKPDKIQATSELKSLFPQLNFKVAIITEEKFEELFEILYSKRLHSIDESEEEEDDTEDIDFMEIDLDENFDENEDKGGGTYNTQDIEAEELVNFIVKYGILNNASDIHIEQDRHGCKLRYRIDGICQETPVEWLRRKLPEKIGAIISRIKVMSNLDIAEKRVPQDGVFRINYYDKGSNKKFDLDFRVATCRAIVGENVTVRILDSRKANVGLDNLKHSPHVLEPFKRLLKSSAGMVLVSGPTGSGKSSTLYGALQYVYNPGVKIITAEDPIEYSFPGIMQTQTLPKIGITFSRLLRSFLRLDPDIILVGEMRDEETAQIGFDAAQTGHLLLSTIHTNDSISAVSRLADMKVEYSQIASCLLSVLAQRLVRQICPFCKKEYIPGEDEWGILYDSYPSHLMFYKGEGCDSCNFSGYKGRTLLSENFVVDREIGAALSKGLQDAEIKKMAIEAGMKTMLDDGILKLEDTTLNEILRVIPHDMIKTFRSRKQVQADVNDLIDNLFDGSGSQAHANLSPETFIISDPSAQDDVLEKMIEKYSIIKTAFGGKKGPEIDKALFKEFISDSFNKIQEKCSCSNVNFTIQENNGKAEISALAE